MPLSAGEIERAERLLKRTIAKRDMLVSQVQLLCDLAHKVATDKDVLPLFRARKKDIGGLRTQCSLEQDSILEILIQLQREEEYNSIHVPIGNKLSENYYLIMAISDDVLVEPSVRSEPTGVNTARIQSRIQLPKIELPSFDARANSTVVLGTAIVHIKDAWGQTHAVRALLDSGSQLSAMTNNCSARLGLPRNRFQSNIVGLGQSPITQIQGVTRCQFTSHFDSKYVFPTVDMVVLPHITAAMPSAHVPSNAGVEHYAGFPSALDTKIGWIIFGSFSTSNTPPLVALTTAVDQSINDQLSRFWEIEEPAASVSPTTEDQWFVGADTEEQLLRRKEAIVGLLHNGACELSKWTSNSALVLGSISPDHRANSVSFDPRDEHSLPEEQWPKSKFSPLSPDQLPETRPNVTTVLTVNVQSPSLELFSRFSSLSKLQRVLSFVLRFLRRLRRQSVNFGPLTLAEREAALFVVVQRTQQHHFSDLSNMLKTKSELVRLPIEP
ncbi:unnamed protein product [Macrosiphum euphorbiae]|uniref:Peptidase A2 domain-containing protein n=1 Tax=Macrosiphum euphorbiae TaxID=13131 RepID=A0AAV0Y6U1_9HEMI|nr:unnamed protein product [Macrosiphum euphorbiae]